ncbi:MAG: TIM44-like domain-containing protein [Myxococcales bacterium]|jgi:hypothetical protein
MREHVKKVVARLGRALGDALSRPGVLWLAVVVLVLLVSAEAWARIGGGDSFSGGRSSGGRSGGSSIGGGGGGGDGDLLFFVIWLCFKHPAIGIPVAIVVGVLLIAKRAGEGKQVEWQTGAAPAAWEPPIPATLRNGRRRLAALRVMDPDFSVVTFEDFLYALYAKAHEARGAKQLDSLSPYLSPAARASFQPYVPGLVGVKGVIVGGMRIVAVRGVAPGAQATSVSVVFETNFTEVRRLHEKDVESTWYSVERWELSRPQGVKSRPPERARKIDCPSCGAALTAIQGSVCSFCGKTVDTGEFDWKVDAIHQLRREERKALFSGTVEEQGTNLPTVVDLDLNERLAELAQRDPEFSLSGFCARAELIFRELQAAWSERDWGRARPFVSDSLFETQSYWVESFKKQGIRNVIENPVVTAVQPASVMSDAHFDAITVRVVASCIDYVVTDDGRHLSGSKSRPRRFTEYWTFIRGAKRKGPAGCELKCPSCGAPLSINQAGHCEYCQAKVTTGEFDWVLSRIEQDEAYGG